MQHLIKWDNTNKLSIIENGIGPLSEDYEFISKLLDNSYNLSKYYSFNDKNFIVPKNQTFKKDNNLKNVLSGGIKKRYYNNEQLYYSTEYQALYPETFYQVWEVLCFSEIINNDNLNIGFIDDGLSIHESFPLGYMEATIKYSETYAKYESFNNIRVLLNPLIKHHNDDKFMNVYKHTTYEFTKSGYHNKLPERIQKYFRENKINCNVLISHSDSIFRNMISLLLCPKNGNVIIYISNYLSDNYLRTIKYISKFFKNTILYKPSVLNKLDPICYLVCKGFIGLTESLNNELLDTIKNEYVYDLSIKNIKNILNNNYKTDILNFLNSLKFNTSENIKDYVEINNTINDESINWLSKYNLKLHSKFDTNFVPTKNNDYISYTFNKYKLDTTIFEINGKFTYSFDNMHSIKRKLNISKRYIDTREQSVLNNPESNVINWKKLSDDVDFFRNLKKVITWKTNAEMAGPSWIRFYEILDTENLFDKNIDSLKTFHICEAPGSYIGSLNHYIKTNTNIKNFDWYAQTLNPKLSNNNPLMSDTFGLMHAYQNRWLFGPKETGDIMDPMNIEYYKLNNNLKNLDLITADGSLIVSESMYNEQEAVMSKLIYAEILAMLYILPKGKNCMFRTFTPFSETSTVSIFYILSCIFDEFKIVKPSTCHSTNSDIFVICKNYYGWEYINESLQNRLFYFLNNFSHNESILPINMISIDFINDLEKCSNLFVDNQIKSIELNLWYYDRFYFDHNIQYDISHQRNELTNNWIQKHNLKPLNPTDYLVKKMKNKIFYEKYT